MDWQGRSGLPNRRGGRLAESAVVPTRAGRRLFEKRADYGCGHASDYKPQEKDRYNDRNYHSRWHSRDLMQVCEKGASSGMA